MDNLPSWVSWIMTIAVVISLGVAFPSVRPIARLLHYLLWPRPEVRPQSRGKCGKWWGRVGCIRRRDVLHRLFDVGDGACSRARGSRFRLGLGSRALAHPAIAQDAISRRRRPAQNNTTMPWTRSWCLPRPARLPGPSSSARDVLLVMPELVKLIE